jgi:signal transduction histidine kinase
MRMRTLLLTPLLLIPILLTSASLLLLRHQTQRQMRESVAADLSHSTATYRNLAQLRRASLGREALLLAYQPSLRALMTTRDPRTIQDEGGTYAQLSGADLFALLSPSGTVNALYGEIARPSDGEMPAQLAEVLGSVLRDGHATTYFFDGARLFEVAGQPIYFGSSSSGSVLGYVLIGTRITDAVAQQVSQTAGSEIAFAVGTKIVAGTLDTQGLQILSPHGTDPDTLELKGKHFLVDRVPLSTDVALPIALVVLRSMEGFQRTQQRLDRIVLLIGLTASLAGVALAFWVARRLTQPLEGLAAGVAAVGAGDYQANLPVSGSSEIRALSSAIKTMRAQIRETQTKLIASERLATIGQMASSVSHDLRHYLASVYANAEFLAASGLSHEERSDLLAEIQMSVQGTTDLIESLLLFTRTGRVLHLSSESVTYLAERAIHRVSQHPDALGVSIELTADGTAEASVDARKIERAIYNLLLNGCQAARQSAAPPRVKINIHEEPETIQLEVSDSGPGVPASIRDRLFDPFFSANKENGIGIGLTLVATIAQEHGGAIRLQSGDGLEVPTVFVFTLDRRCEVVEHHASPDVSKGARL